MLRVLLQELWPELLLLLLLLPQLLLQLPRQRLLQLAPLL